MRSFEHKLDRALDHLGALHTASERFFEGGACEASLDCDVQTREHVLTFRVRDEIPGEFAALAADCFHNLRQALDHIAYRLAIAISGRNPPPNETGIYFPITSSPQQFEGQLGSCLGSPKKIPASVRTVLENAQPCEGGDAQYLAVLQDLDNLDKHRAPPLMVVGGLIPAFNIGSLSVSSMTGPRLGPVEDGTEIMRFVPADLDAPMDMDFPMTMHVAFGKGGPGQGLAVLPFLYAVRNLIREDIARPLDSYL